MGGVGWGGGGLGRDRERCCVSLLCQQMKTDLKHKSLGWERRKIGVDATASVIPSSCVREQTVHVKFAYRSSIVMVESRFHIPDPTRPSQMAHNAEIIFLFFFHIRER